MADEDMERKRAAALRLMGAQPQTQPAQEQMRQAQPPPISLSELRPVIRQDVESVQRNAQQLFVAFLGMDIRGKPGLESEMSRADSQLLRIYRMEEGRS